MTNGDSMKVLFLDIDGVLNNATTKRKCISEKYKWARGVDIELSAKYLAWLKGKPITVVLSSMWRWHDDLMVELNDHGIYWANITSRDRPFEQSPFRGNEVEHWLQEHPEATHYAILDDLRWFHPHQESHLVLTNPAIGVTDADLTKVEKILDLNE